MSDVFDEMIELLKTYGFVRGEVYKLPNGKMGVFIGKAKNGDCIFTSSGKFLFLSPGGVLR